MIAGCGSVSGFLARRRLVITSPARPALALGETHTGLAVAPWQKPTHASQQM
jgi:hypothetical protein